MRLPTTSVFVLDNYDSFTFNLVQYLGALGASLEVRRNDEVRIDHIASARPDAVVISPGPGTPRAAGISLSLVEWCADTRTPLLGVCLGHQAIAQAFGGRVVRAPEIVHGKSSVVHHTAEGALAGIPTPFEAARYHSLVVERVTVPADLEVSAWTVEGVVMGVRHLHLPIEGVQFHPESILTEGGTRILGNFLASARRGEPARRQLVSPT